jgi:hypothetical protein
MAYPLTITILAGLLLLALLATAVLLARRAAEAGGWGNVRGWRWYPSPLGLLILLPLAALLVWRLFPAVLLIPVVLPFFWRGRRLAGPLLFFWNLGRRANTRPDDDGDDDRAIDGRHRPLDDD